MRLCVGFLDFSRLFWSDRSSWYRETNLRVHTEYTRPQSEKHNTQILHIITLISCPQDKLFNFSLVSPIVEHWVEWKIAQLVHHEGLIQQPIAPWADILPQCYISLPFRDLSHTSSHTRDSTSHGLCYTSCGALAGTKNNSVGQPINDLLDSEW